MRFCVQGSKALKQVPFLVEYNQAKFCVPSHKLQQLFRLHRLDCYLIREDDLDLDVHFNFDSHCDYFIKDNLNRSSIIHCKTNK